MPAVSLVASINARRVTKMCEGSPRRHRARGKGRSLGGQRVGRERGRGVNAGRTHRRDAVGAVRYVLYW
jgi:hypothetical protein